MNNNSCNNFIECLTNNTTLPFDKKNFKNFPRRLSKRAKTKNKYFDNKKQFFKNFSNLNTNKMNENNQQNNKCNEYKGNIFKIEKLEDVNNTTLNKFKDKENKNRNLGNSLNKEKTISSLEKYKFNSEYQSKRNTFSNKESCSCKNVIKIEIDSINKIGISKEKEEKNNKIMEIKINEDKNNIINYNKKNEKNNNENK